MSGSGAFDASTPADAQTKPWVVSAMTSGGRKRTIRALSRRIDLEPTRIPVAGERSSPLGRLDVGEADDPALRLRDDLLRDDDDVAVLELGRSAIRRARSSPGPISGRPSTGRTFTRAR